ncbi:hypothetical protein GGC65_001876 [Sphingopyxis sp. OAS728]|uniref:hypothetical protein n=1 Tax=Sphingopyxis sp. OAS728 TaxID=2663823 RepID=UPI0017898EF2|nr:hypothetical protein [Sphingopyxis sp. OAS728]MBE1527420.1 hypothetical protein [Sphingopyxis sp. OAS728]
MRKAFALLTVAPALLVYPAFAQLAPDGSANVNLVGKVGLNGGAVQETVEGVAKPVGGTVGKAVDDANLTLATREQVRAGAELYDTGGNSVGTVQSVEGDTAIVVRGGKLYNVPIAQIYHGAVGATHGLVTKLSAAEIQARTTAAIESR